MSRSFGSLFGHFTLKGQSKQQAAMRSLETKTIGWTFKLGEGFYCLAFFALGKTIILRFGLKNNFEDRFFLFFFKMRN